MRRLRISRTGRAGRTGAVRRIMSGVRTGASRLRPLSDRRRVGRAPGRGIGCNLGEIQDISAAGLRLHSSRRYQGSRYVEIWTATQRVRVLAEIVWSNRLGFRKYELGLKFRDLDEQTAGQLTSFASLF